MDKTSANDPMQNPPPLAGLDPAELLRQGAADNTFADAGASQPPSIEEMAVLLMAFASFT